MRISKPSKHQILKQELRADSPRDEAFRRVILSIPRGKVVTYGEVAAAAGYPLRHRAVAKMLRNSHGTLPWQRIVGSGGAIRTRGEHALEQRLRLQLEGVLFRGRQVDMNAFSHKIVTWEL